MVATTFELARSLFHPALSISARHFVERHLPATAASWVRAYGRTGAIHCYRNNRNALLLHLGLLDDNAQRWALVRQRLLPRHLPLPTYGVQTPPEAQDLKFRVVKGARYLQLLLQRGLFHLRSLGGLLLSTPALAHSASAAAKRSRGTRPALTLNWSRPRPIGFLDRDNRRPEVGSHSKHLKPEFGRHCDAAHLAGGDQLPIEADKLVAGNRNAEIYNVQSVEKVGP